MDLAVLAAGRRIDHYVAIGGSASSNLWLQILADVLGIEVKRSSAIEASSLGAAIAAANGVGWHGSFAETAAAMVSEPREAFVPDPHRFAAYGELRQIHSELWTLMSAWNRRLAEFTTTIADQNS